MYSGGSLEDGFMAGGLIDVEDAFGVLFCIGGNDRGPGKGLPLVYHLAISNRMGRFDYGVSIPPHL